MAGFLPTQNLGYGEERKARRRVASILREDQIDQIDAEQLYRRNSGSRLHCTVFHRRTAQGAATNRSLHDLSTAQGLARLQGTPKNSGAFHAPAHWMGRENGCIRYCLEGGRSILIGFRRGSSWGHSACGMT